jgi:hypothetical protein
MAWKARAADRRPLALVCRGDLGVLGERAGPRTPDPNRSQPMELPKNPLTKPKVRDIVRAVYTKNAYLSRV